MLLAGSTRSPSIPNGVLAWFEGDVFTLNLKGKLLDQDEEPVEMPEGATLKLRVYNERREIVKEFERVPDENGNITIDIDEETTALFPWGKYKGQMIYTDANRRVTIGVYDIIVGDIEHHKHNKYSVNAEFVGWISRGVRHAEIDSRGHLLFNMTDGNTLDLGTVGTGGAGGIGGYYTPTVSEDGVLTWMSSDPGMPEAESANVRGPNGKDGEPGRDGADGGYYAPSVSAAGDLTWTGSKTDMPAVAPVNIKGAPGKDGTSVEVENVTTSTEPGGINEVTFTGGKKLQVRNGLNGSGGGDGGEDGGYYTPTVSADGTLTWTPSNPNMPAAETANIMGPKGDKGDPGNPGSDAAVTPANVAAAIGEMTAVQSEAARESLGALPDTYVPPAAPVQSVNGKTGVVNLTAENVGARPDTWMPTAAEVGALSVVRTGDIVGGAITRAKLAADAAYSPIKGVTAASYAVAAADMGYTLHVSSGSTACTLTLTQAVSQSIPNGAELAVFWRTGTSCTLQFEGGIRVVIPGESGMLKNPRIGIRQLYAMVALKKFAPDATNGDLWTVQGNVEVVT